MAIITLLDLGANPDDNTGDTLRAGGQKINDNFTAVNTQLSLSNKPLSVFNGSVLDDMDSTITSDGVTATFSLQKAGAAADLEIQFSDGRFQLDTFPTAKTIMLTSGTSTVPVINFVFIPQNTKVLTVNSTGFPAVEHAPVAKIFLLDAASTQNDEALSFQKIEDHASDTVLQGHNTHIGAKLRTLHADYISGMATSFVGSGTASVTMGITAGVGRQVHTHNTPLFTAGTDFYVVNDPATAYRKTTDLATIQADSLGGTLLNRSYQLVISIIVNEVTGDSKTLVTLPGGSYARNDISGARTDGLGFQNTTIPADLKGTVLLIHRLIMDANGAATIFTVNPGNGDDLRGTAPNGAAGGSSSGTLTEFPTNLFAWIDATDATKKSVINNSAITTGTTRTLILPDNDVDLGSPTFVTVSASFVGDGSAITNFGIDDLKDAIHDTDDFSSLYMGNGAGASDDGAVRNNLGIGLNALSAIVTGSGCTGIGNNALNNCTVSLNTATGTMASFSNTTGIGNCSYGADSQLFVTIGSRNNSSGKSSLASTKTGDDNTVSGFQAGFGAINASDFNRATLSGSRSGKDLRTLADDNTFYGFETGLTVTTGKRLILIGSGIDAPTPTTEDHLNIGDVITGDLVTQEVTFPGAVNTTSLIVGRTATAISGTFGANETIIGVTDTSASRTITLATAALTDGKTLAVQDESGGAVTNNITIDTQGAELINGAASISITTNFGAFDLYSDGTNWFAR